MAYAEATKVAFEQSVMEIMKMIRRAGAEQVGQMEDARFFAVQFTLADRMIRFRVPFPALGDMPDKDGYGRALPAGKRAEKLEQAKRQKGRALMLVIKAKLESVESGVETIEQALLANVVMADGLTVYERIAAPLALEYKEGRPNPAVGLLAAPQAA
jgi:hypothetical protein